MLAGQRNLTIHPGSYVTVVPYSALDRAGNVPAVMPKTMLWKARVIEIREKEGLVSLSPTFKCHLDARHMSFPEPGTCAVVVHSGARQGRERRVAAISARRL